MSSEEEGAVGGEDDRPRVEVKGALAKGKKGEEGQYRDLPASGITRVLVVVVVTEPTFLLLQALYAFRRTVLGDFSAPATIENVRIRFVRSSGSAFQGRSRPYLNGRGEQVIIPMLPGTTTVVRALYEKMDKDEKAERAARRKRGEKVKKAQQELTKGDIITYKSGTYTPSIPVDRTVTRKKGAEITKLKTMSIAPTEPGIDDAPVRMETIVRLDIGNAQLPDLKREDIARVLMTNAAVIFTRDMDHVQSKQRENMDMNLHVFHVRSVTLTFLMQVMREGYGAETTDRQTIGSFSSALLQVASFPGQLRSLALDDKRRDMAAFLPTTNGQTPALDFLEEEAEEIEAWTRDPDVEVDVVLEDVMEMNAGDLAEGAESLPSPFELPSDQSEDADTDDKGEEDEGDDDGVLGFVLPGVSEGFQTPEATGSDGGTRGSSGNPASPKRSRLNVEGEGGRDLGTALDAVATDYGIGQTGAYATPDQQRGQSQFVSFPEHGPFSPSPSPPASPPLNKPDARPAGDAEELDIDDSDSVSWE